MDWKRLEEIEARAKKIPPLIQMACHRGGGSVMDGVDSLQVCQSDIPWLCDQLREMRRRLNELERQDDPRRDKTAWDMTPQEIRDAVNL